MASLPDGADPTLVAETAEHAQGAGADAGKAAGSEEMERGAEEAEVSAERRPPPEAEKGGAVADIPAETEAVVETETAAAPADGARAAGEAEDRQLEVSQEASAASDTSNGHRKVKRLTDFDLLQGNVH